MSVRSACYTDDIQFKSFILKSGFDSLVSAHTLTDPERRILMFPMPVYPCMNGLSDVTYVEREGAQHRPLCYPTG